MRSGRRRRIGSNLLWILLVLPVACAPSPEERAARTLRGHVQRADLALARGQDEGAEREYAAALSLSAGSEAAQLGLARALASQGRSEEALSHYDALGAQHPAVLAGVRAGELCPLLLRVAGDGLRAGSAEKSLALARRARAESCEAAALAPVLARALTAVAERQRESDPVGAADLFVAAAAANPANPAAFVRAGVLLLWIDRREEALALLSEALRHHPQDPDLRSLMVDALARRAPGIDPFASSPPGVSDHRE